MVNKTIFLLAVLLSGCASQPLTDINAVRQSLEPVTDFNCLIAGYVEAAIKPEFLTTTQAVCDKIKKTYFRQNILGDL